MASCCSSFWLLRVKVFQWEIHMHYIEYGSLQELSLNIQSPVADLWICGLHICWHLYI